MAPAGASSWPACWNVKLTAQGLRGWWQCPSAVRPGAADSCACWWAAPIAPASGSGGGRRRAGVTGCLCEAGCACMHLWPRSGTASPRCRRRRFHTRLAPIKRASRTSTSTVQPAAHQHALQAAGQQVRAVQAEAQPAHRVRVPVHRRARGQPRVWPGSARVERQRCCCCSGGGRVAPLLQRCWEVAPDQDAAADVASGDDAVSRVKGGALRGCPPVMRGADRGSGKGRQQRE